MSRADTFDFSLADGVVKEDEDEEAKEEDGG